jgi:tetratricopeptide (TPR) repeat protein
MRILRTIQAPGQPTRYEIFHDVVAQAILTWRRRYVARQQEERIRREEQELVKQHQAETERRLELERARRLRRVIIALSAILVIMAGQMGYAFWQRTKARRAYRQLGGLQRQINEKQKEIEAAREQLKRTRDAAEHMRQGQLLAQAREYPESIAEFNQALELDPNNPNAYNQKGYAYLRSGNYQEAIDSLKRSLEIDPNFVWGHYNLALAYWAVNERDQAVKEVEEVLRVKPEFRKTIAHDGQFSKFNVSPEYVRLIESSDPHQ